MSREHRLSDRGNRFYVRITPWYSVEGGAPAILHKINLLFKFTENQESRKNIKNSLPQSCSCSSLKVVLERYNVNVSPICLLVYYYY